jgi:cytochrome c556
MHMAATLLAQDVRNVVTNSLDVRQHLHEPEGIRRWAVAIPGLFPAGSQGDSRARPEIWRNKADFDAKAEALAAAATELARRGEAGDTAGYAAQAKVVQSACAACHAAYRAN